MCYTVQPIDFQNNHTTTTLSLQLGFQSNQYKFHNKKKNFSYPKQRKNIIKNRKNEITRKRGFDVVENRRTIGRSTTGEEPRTMIPFPHFSLNFWIIFFKD